MADYYSILNKTISGLATNTADVRQTVYTKARTAIESQLRKIDPSPGEEAIAGQLQLLEEAIMVIEAENSPEPIEQELEEIIEIDEPETVDEIELAPEETQVEEPAPVHIEDPSPVSVEDQLSSLAEEPDPAVVAEPPTAPMVSPEPEMPVEPAVPPANAATVENAPAKKSGIVRRLITWLVVLGVLGGAGYAAWANRTLFEPLIASVMGDGSSEVVPGDDNAASGVDENSNVGNNDDTSEVEKEAVRLTSEGEDEATEAPQTTETELQPREVPVVLDQSGEATTENVAEPEVEAVEEAQEAEGADQTEVPATPAPATLGEVAYLYEEGSAGSGATRASASVNWSLVQVKPTESLPPEAVVVGKMEVPEKGLSVDINIKRNVDPALSASHIIELSFEVPEGFEGGGIDNIARFVMKPTEEARGEPLVAVPVKVNDGYFLIALDNLDQAIEVNRQLLLNSSWVDIPLSYSTGKRALLTLEKGGTGDQVFKSAFDDWKNR